LLGRGRSAAKAANYVRRVDAPHPAAGFFRRSALEVTGGLSEYVGDRTAIIDLALTLCELGFGTALEPKSEVLAPADIDLRCGSFRRSLELERLFWRWAPQGPWPWALACHAAVVTGELVAGLPRLKTPAQLTARMLGSLTFGSHRRNRLRLDQLLGRLDARAAVSPPHFRVEGLRSVSTVR
jgi:hypothetical protein